MGEIHEDEIIKIAIALGSSFCNTTTSRNRNPENMAQLISDAKGEPDAAANEVVLKLKEVLKRDLGVDIGHIVSTP